MVKIGPFNFFAYIRFIISSKFAIKIEADTSLSCVNMLE
jgi:hypothetical protein